jgi:hypothetical protein
MRNESVHVLKICGMNLFIYLEYAEQICAYYWEYVECLKSWISQLFRNQNNQEYFRWLIKMGSFEQNNWNKKYLTQMELWIPFLRQPKRARCKLKSVFTLTFSAYLWVCVILLCELVTMPGYFTLDLFLALFSNIILTQLVFARCKYITTELVIYFRRSFLTCCPA